MKGKQERRRCPWCKRLFVPDPRTRGRQKVCGKVECQEARMAENRRAWLTRPENAHYGRDNLKAKERTKEWRKKHPGYWRKGGHAAPSTLSEQRVARNPDGNPPAAGTLPEERLPDDPVIVGLFAEIAGSTLPEQIARVYQRVVAKGREILRTQRAGRVVVSASASPPSV